MGATYEQDLVLWANEQAALLRAGRFSDVDIEHVANEIEDVGKAAEVELLGALLELRRRLAKAGSNVPTSIRMDVGTT